MKKGVFLSIVNWILVFSIPGVLLTGNINSNVIDSSVNTKNINTDIIKQVLSNDEIKKSLSVQKEKDSEKENEKENIEELEIPNVNDNFKKEEIKEETQAIEEKKEETVPTIKEEKVTSSIATYTGTASYYTANCVGCGGYTSSGLNVSDGRLFYSDAAYGNVRIVAAGREIPLYSIVRLNNTSLGTNSLAIVLDRGGDIGEGRRFIVDILTNDSEGKGGIERNVSVEVLRSGR